MIGVESGVLPGDPQSEAEVNLTPHLCAWEQSVSARPRSCPVAPTATDEVVDRVLAQTEKADALLIVGFVVFSFQIDLGSFGHIVVRPLVHRRREQQQGARDVDAEELRPRVSGALNNPE